MISQAPFDYLKGKYGENIVIILFDVHPDISGTNFERRFPSIIDSTVIGWFQPWTKKSLTSVARGQLKKDFEKMPQ